MFERIPELDQHQPAGGWMRTGVRRPVLFPMPDEAPVIRIVLPSNRFAIAVAMVRYVKRRNGGREEGIDAEEVTVLGIAWWVNRIRANSFEKTMKWNLDEVIDEAPNPRLLLILNHYRLNLDGRVTEFRHILKLPFRDSCNNILRINLLAPVSLCDQPLLLTNWTQSIFRSILPELEGLPIPKSLV